MAIENLIVNKRNQTIPKDQGPFMLPPLNDVFEPLIKRETVRFNPFNGAIFVLGQRNEKNQIEVDKLDPKKESFWLNFSTIDESISSSEKFYHDQGKSITVNNTVEIISLAIDNFPQFVGGELNEKTVRNIINNICLNLVINRKIIDGDNQEYIEHVLHNFRGIRSEHYSEQEKKSRVGSVVLDVINSLIEKRGKAENYSPTLANLLVEQQIEQRSLTNLQANLTESLKEHLHPHFYDLDQLKTSLLKLDKKFFGFPVFRCAPNKQSAEKVKKTILAINRVIIKYTSYNAPYSVDIISELIKNI